MSQQDTIVAIATPVGRGGIGIIKLSGPDALRMAAPLFRCRSFDPASPRPRHLYYGVIVDPRDAHNLDEVLLCFMPAPRTYTGEDVVEINCHSGQVILQKILALLLHNGARLAEPGEFTKRAFLNSRIDLTQAEAVIDLIEAKTEAGLKIASRQLHGSLSEKLRAVQDALRHELRKLDRDAYIVAVEPERVMLVGARPWSTYWAVCQFLEDVVGVRWLIPGPLGEAPESGRAVAAPAAAPPGSAHAPHCHSQYLGEGSGAAGGGAPHPGKLSGRR